MHTLLVLYSALAVFGIGVTIVDLFGVFEHAGQDDVSSGPDDDGAPGHDDDGAAGHDDDGSSGHDHVPEMPHQGEAHGSYISTADSGARFVARTIGALRTGVYFSLGAGPTGLFAVLTDVNPAEGLAWSAGAGIFIAVLARSIRRFVRKDLDSSIKPAEFIMDEATILVSIAPGAMGKAVVRRYGRETELFVRAKNPALAFSKGSLVRIVDFDDDCYWVDAL